MKIRKSFFAVAVMILIVGAVLSGCASNDTSAAGNYKTIAPPENGWTDELINSVLYLDGKPFSMPVSVDELEGYVWDKENEDEHYIDKDNSDKQVITSNLIDQKNKLLIASADQNGMVCQIGVHSDRKDYSYCDLVLNGISIGSTYDELVNALGQPDDGERESTVVSYTFSDSDDICISIMLIEKGDEKIANLIKITNGNYYN
ncbi:MAG: hypothetical protein ACI4RH_05995 [Huintestinicola sp.]